MKLLNTLIISSFFIFIGCNMPEPRFDLLAQKELQAFPSASAIDFHNDKLYVTGDDARHLMILDTMYNVVDTITLFPGEELRIPKKEKADLEASAVIFYNNKEHLLVAGSSSKAERELMYLFPLDDLHNYQKVSTISLSEALRKQGIKELNIEGVAGVKDRLVFGNRGNFSNPGNHLMIVPASFLAHPDTVQPAISELVLKEQKDVVIGLSGLSYIDSTDVLLFTASVEHTQNSTDDGDIGDSYLGYIRSFSSKLRQAEIVPDTLINLSQKDKKFMRHKIESVCVESATNDLILHLVADNDDGTSTLFKLRMDLPL
ncbi:MAG TPA: hypothetical protein VD996_08840 [Chitinophagaceae bacterium]|nr:hypothetical protein [Chitinophagaceae bacterium]